MTFTTIPIDENIDIMTNRLFSNAACFHGHIESPTHFFTFQDHIPMVNSVSYVGSNGPSFAQPSIVSRNTYWVLPSLKEKLLKQATRTVIPHSQEFFSASIPWTGQTASIDYFKILSSCANCDELQTRESLLQFPSSNFPWTSKVVLSLFSY
jgi:hypothetical protein